MPFATLILLTAIQSLDSKQLETAEIDGAPKVKQFLYIIVPHLGRAINVVILIQTIFLFSDPVEHPDQLQDRGGRHRLPAEIPVL